MADSPDPHHLSRFVEAQESDYAMALAEMRNGRKRSHWMWYVFPQFEGLGLSPTSRHYAIKSRAEAESYLRHSVLGPRLVECCEVLLGTQGRSASDIFGPVDAMKLRSSATLFASVSARESVFARLLEKYFHGDPDEETLILLGARRTSDSG